MLGAVDTRLRLPDRRRAGCQRRSGAARGSRRAWRRAASRSPRRSRSSRRCSIASRSAQAVPAAASSIDDRRAIAPLARDARARNGAARLPDLRAGPRRPRARARRGDRLLDDAPAPAGVRARERRRATPSGARASPPRAARRGSRHDGAAPPSTRQGEPCAGGTRRAAKPRRLPQPGAAAAGHAGAPGAAARRIPRRGRRSSRN